MSKRITLEISDVLAGYIAGLSAHARERGAFVEDAEIAGVLLNIGAVSMGVQGRTGADLVTICVTNGSDHGEQLAHALAYGEHSAEAAAEIPPELREHIRDSAVILRDVVDANQDVVAKRTGTA